MRPTPMSHKTSRNKIYLMILTCSLLLWIVYHSWRYVCSKFLPMRSFRALSSGSYNISVLAHCGLVILTFDLRTFTVQVLDVYGTSWLHYYQV